MINREGWLMEEEMLYPEIEGRSVFVYMCLYVWICLFECLLVVCVGARACARVPQRITWGVALEKPFFLEFLLL